MTNRPTTSSADPRFVLLIGVNAYPYWRMAPRSLDAPANDLARWIQLLARLGVPAQQVEVLTSPALGAEALVQLGVPPAYAADLRLGEANTEGVNAAARRVEAARTGFGPSGLSLVVFSGHGDVTADDRGIGVLGDYNGDAPPADSGAVAERGILRLANLYRALAGDGGEGAVVAVVDTCRQLDPQHTIPADRPRPRLRNLIVVPTAQLGADAGERRFDGVARSVGSWALQTVLEQWHAAPLAHPRGSSYVAISYGQLVQRANDLAAGFPGPGGAQRLRFRSSRLQARDPSGQAVVWNSRDMGFLHSFDGPGGTEPVAVRPRAHQFARNTRWIFRANDFTTVLGTVAADENGTHRWDFTSSSPLANVVAADPAPAFPDGDYPVHFISMAAPWRERGDPTGNWWQSAGGEGDVNFLPTPPRSGSTWFTGSMYRETDVVANFYVQSIGSNAAGNPELRWYVPVRAGQDAAFGSDLTSLGFTALAAAPTPGPPPAGWMWWLWREELWTTWNGNPAPTPRPPQ